MGDGTTINRNTPGQVENISDVTAISGGYYHTIALTGKAKAKNSNPLDVIAIVPIGADASFHVVATTDSSVTILLSADVDFGIEIQANDNRFLVN